MVDITKLNVALARNGITREKLAERIGIALSTMGRKISGESDFYRHEIIEISKELNLTEDATREIFFA